MSRPQFGSPPWIAVLTSGEFADRPRRQPRVAARRGAGHVDGDELGRAFAAAHDLAREVAGHGAQRLDQARVVVVGDHDARRAGRQQRTRSRWSSTRRRR